MEQEVTSSNNYKKPAIIAGTVVGVLTIMVVGASAANAAIPGQALYPLDLALEDLQRQFLFSAESKAAFESDVLDERLEELDAIEGGEFENEQELVEIIMNQIEDGVEELDELEDEIETENEIENEHGAEVEVEDETEDESEDESDTDEDRSGSNSGSSRDSDDDEKDDEEESDDD